MLCRSGQGTKSTPQRTGWKARKACCVLRKDTQKQIIIAIIFIVIVEWAGRAKKTRQTAPFSAASLLNLAPSKGRWTRVPAPWYRYSEFSALRTSGAG